MKHYYLPPKGNFYKVNMHCHTTISDGKQTPEEIKKAYQSLGYDAVCYTDHEVIVGHEDLCDDNFIALHGYEVAIKQHLDGHTGYFQPVYHFNFIAKEQPARRMPRFFLKNPSIAGHAAEWIEKVGVYDENDIIETTNYDVDWINEYLKAVSEAGFLISYNHPEWSLQNLSDYVGLEHCHAVEVINGAMAQFFEHGMTCYDQMLRAGKRLIVVGGDDNHAASECGLGWTMIKAEALTYEALIAAYERGDCYVSEGPEFLELFREDDEIVVRAKGAARILLRGEGRYHKLCRFDTDREIAEARFAYHPEQFGRYFRVELIDEHGKKAFSRAYFV